MVFSFAKKGNTQPWRGTWGSPFGMLRWLAAERLGDGQWPSVAVGPKSDLYKAGNDCDASKLDFRRIRPSVKAAQTRCPQIAP
jgi:hypothetical protein